MNKYFDTKKKNHHLLKRNLFTFVKLKAEIIFDFCACKVPYSTIILFVSINSEYFLCHKCIFNQCY